MYTINRIAAKRWLAGAILATTSLLPVQTIQADEPDFGERTDQVLRAQSSKLFGFNKPL